MSWMDGIDLTTGRSRILTNEEKRMTEPDTRTHGEILLDLVRSRTSGWGDKTWSMAELVEHTGLRPHQVSNAIVRITREAKRDNEEPLLRVKTGTRGQYVYTGPLKRGRKKANGAPAADVPTEDWSDLNLLDPDVQLASEGGLEDEDQVVAANEAATPKPTLAEGFAQVGEKFAEVMGGIGVSLGVAAPRASAMNQAMDAEKAAELQSKALRNNRVTRVIRRMRELADEMGYLENEWDALAEKGRRYDKLTMTMFGFSSNDPAAVDHVGDGSGGN